MWTKVRSGVAYYFVTLSGQDRSCGRADDPETFATYARLVREWELRGRQPERKGEPAPAVTVARFVELYRDHLIAKRGAAWLQPMAGGSRTHYAVETLRAVCGPEPVAAFDAQRLEAVRAAMLAGGAFEGARRCCRTEANARTAAIQRAMRWAHKRGLVDAVAWSSILAVEPIQRGEDGATERAARTDVAADVVEATLGYMRGPLSDVVRLLLATGARPSEVLGLRVGEVDRADPEQWTAVLARHKTAHRGKVRVLVFEREAQRILAPYLDGRDADAALFEPVGGFVASCRRRAAEYAEARGEDPTAEDAAGSRRIASRPRRSFAPAYDARALAKAIRRAVVRANADRRAAGLDRLPHWTPYQLRHAVATAAAVHVDAGTAGDLLGHASAAVTARYTHAEVERAKRASARLRTARSAVS